MAGLYPGFQAGVAPFVGNEFYVADAPTAGGVPPQSESITLLQTKDFVLGGNYANPSTRTATASAGAATLNSGYGVITTESLTTAAAAVYTLTLTNAAIAAADIVHVTVGNGTNTTVGPSLAGVTPAAGSVVIVIRNTHAASALNGTLRVAFTVVKG